MTSFKDWSLKEMIQFINRIKEEVNSKYNNEHAQWLCKQDLYKLKWEIEAALSKCNTFEGEDDFLKSHERKEFLKKIDNTNVQKS